MECFKHRVLGAGEEVVTALGTEVDRLEKEIQDLVPGIRHVDIEAHNPVDVPSSWHLCVYQYITWHSFLVYPRMITDSGLMLVTWSQLIMLGNVHSELLLPWIWYTLRINCLWYYLFWRAYWSTSYLIRGVICI